MLISKDIKTREVDPGRRRVDRRSDISPQPLYSGSKVCFETSKLLDSDDPFDLEYTLRKYKERGAVETFSDEEGDEAHEPDVLDDASLAFAGFGYSYDEMRDELQDHDIPESAQELRRLMISNEEAVMDWIPYAKDMTCGKPLKGDTYSTGRAKPASMVEARKALTLQNELTSSQAAQESGEGMIGKVERKAVAMKTLEEDRRLSTAPGQTRRGQRQRSQSESAPKQSGIAFCMGKDSTAKTASVRMEADAEWVVEMCVSFAFLVFLLVIWRGVTVRG